MKKLTSEKFPFVCAVIAFALVAGGWSHNANAQTPPATEVADTPAPPVTPVVPPPNIVPGSPYAEVVRLTQAGVDQDIITAYVGNSTSLFNLDSDKIIYLSNLGAPNALVTAMMQRDQLLQQQFAATQAAQQTPPAPAPAPETTPPNTVDMTPAPEPEPPVTVNYFYDTLVPYGNWVVVGGYGRCWRPTVCVYNSGWQPYCDHGHWVYTDCGWYWVSDYSWGATFHYGRWFRDASFGWCWYPDTVWAPSWVTWRYSNNYCGWAPLPPRTAYQAGVGIVYNGGNVSVGFNFGLGANCFTFVPTAYFCNPHPRNYCVAPAQVTQIYNNTTVINNYNINNRTIVNHGIAVENIAVASHTPIRPVPVHQINNPVVRGWQGQPFNRPGPVSGPGHQANTRDFGSPLRTPGAPQNSSPQPQVQHSAPVGSYYPHPQAVPVRTPPANPYNANPQPAPTRFNNMPYRAQTEHSTTVAMVPPRQAPVINYHPQPQAAPVQTPPAANYYPQPAPSPTQPTETPRNMSRDYESHPNSYRPPAAPAPQPAAPAHASASSQPRPQSNGNQNGNQNWPSH